LRGQPFVHDQRLVLPAGVEIGECRLAFRAVGGVDVGQCGEGGELVGHVVGVVELLQRQLANGRGVEFEQVGEAGVAQGAAAGLFAGRCVGGIRRERGVEAGELAFELLGEVAAQGVAGGVQRIRIHFVHGFGQRRFAGQGQGFGDEGGATFGLGQQQAAGGFDKAGWPGRRLAGGDGGRSLENQRRGEALAGFPGVERVAFVRQQQRELFRRVVEVEVDRRREIAQQGGRRLGSDGVEDE